MTDKLKEVLEEIIANVYSNVEDLPLDDRPRIDPGALEQPARSISRTFAKMRREGKSSHEVDISTFHENDVKDFCTLLEQYCRPAKARYERVSGVADPRWKVVIQL